MVGTFFLLLLVSPLPFFAPLPNRAATAQIPESEGFFHIRKYGYFADGDLRLKHYVRNSCHFTDRACTK